MRLLLDESVPKRFGRSLTGHLVQTVVEVGWAGVKNGQLLALAAAKFDAFITVDKNLPYQQNLQKLPITLVVLDSASSELPALMELVPLLLKQLETLRPNSYVVVGRKSGVTTVELK